ncbi:hypothetical protein ECANGB1_1431 [Enterospora canceri]|uniref:DASH complex subunit ASK1 n=1 Tax=Enterospora canceri TaxID=1081671 RepID=A0A1Y1S6U0_9MICR|nr:hypothetical protein ECANGB1_1431 [Enterospora canceri]
MGDIENDERIISYLEKIDNKFCEIKNILREIRGKVKKHAEINRNIRENLMSWNRFFKFDDELNQKDATLNDTTIFEEISPRMSVIANEINDEDEKENNLRSRENTSHYDNLSTPLKQPISQHTNLDTLTNTSKTIEHSTAAQPLTKESLPQAFANESVLLEIYNFVKSIHETDIDPIRSRFNSTSHKKLEIFVNFLVGRDYLGKRNNRLYFKN